MDLKEVFDKAYNIEYKSVTEVDPEFVSDVGKLLSHLNKECEGFLTFKLSKTSGGIDSVVLICEDAAEGSDKMTAVALSKTYDAGGRKVQVGSNHQDPHDVTTAQGLDYFAEDIVDQVARDFAEIDMRAERVAIVNRDFNL